MTSKHESWRDVLPMPVHPAADMFPMMSEAGRQPPGLRWRAP